MRPALTIIFDRSSFHGERFLKLQGSSLLSLVRRGVVLVHHTPAFLEETISMYEKPQNRDELRKQLPFIFEICNGRWFRQPEDIWHIELVQNRGLESNVFEKEWRRKDAENRMQRGALGSEPWRELLNSLPFKDVERQKQARLRQIQAEMRQTIASARKASSSLKNQRPPDALDFVSRELDSWGKLFIDKFIGRRRKQVIYNRWRLDKTQYPFFTSFLQGYLFSDWYALVEHNKAIDLNAQVDIQLLCCLHKADAIVTCDDKFLRDTFDVLWRPIGKRLYSTDELVTYLDHLS